jgi:DnaJ-domain-containing protein 1
MGIPRLILLFAGMWVLKTLLRIVTRRSVGGRPRPGGYGQWGPRSEPTPGYSDRYRSPYEVLGVESGASQEEISGAYRRLVQQYHPDRVADLGPELREVAEQRMKEINAAYQELKQRPD